MIATVCVTLAICFIVVAFVAILFGAAEMCQDRVGASRVAFAIALALIGIALLLLAQVDWALISPPTREHLR